MTGGFDQPVAGSVDPRFAGEFPGLGIASVMVAAGARRTPDGLAIELAAAADRIRGGSAATAAVGTVASAVRSLLRQLGMDPGSVPGTLDSVIRRRLVEGGFRPSGLIEDALTLTVLELGLPMVALDEARLEGEIGIGRADSDGVLHREGDLVLSDSVQVVSRLFGEPFPEFVPGRRTRSLRVVAVSVPGVEPGFAEAALERAAELMS